MSNQIGKVVHYYDKLGVVVVKLDKKLKVGDKVKFTHGEDSFEQTVESMQLDHEPVNEGAAKDEARMITRISTMNNLLIIFSLGYLESIYYLY